MHQDLIDVLDEVWARRVEIMAEAGDIYLGDIAADPDENDAIWMIYAIYTAAEDRVAKIPHSTWLPFVESLARLQALTGATAELQSYRKDIDNLDQVHRDAQRAYKTWKRIRTKNQVASIDLAKEAAGDFVHYRKTSAIACRERIYINAALVHRGEVFKEIVSRIWNVVGFLNAKVDGPLGPQDRRDTIVIYLFDQAAVDEVVLIITDYQRTKAHHFRDAVPVMTAAVPGLVGVSRGMEPPGIFLVQQGANFVGLRYNQSFGFYRASLIFRALRDAGTANEQGFLRKIREYFAAGGVDIDNPGLQGAVLANAYNGPGLGY